MKDKSTKKKFSDFDQELENSLHKLGVNNVNLQRQISPEEIIYLLDRCPFLQIIATNAKVLASHSSLQLVSAKSGWKIQNYFHAMNSSPGMLLFGGGDFRFRFPEEQDKDGSTGGTVINPGKGTIYNQAIMTANEMVALALQQGWHGIKVVDGHPLMILGAWMEASDLGMGFEGYTPSEQDLAKRRRIKRSRSEQETIRHRIKP